MPIPGPKYATAGTGRVLPTFFRIFYVTKLSYKTLEMVGGFYARIHSRLYYLFIY